MILLFALMIGIPFVLANSVVITPSNPTITDTLMCDVTESDAEYLYTWYKNGVAIVNTGWTQSTTLTPDHFDFGDTIECEAYRYAFGIKIKIGEDSVVIGYGHKEVNFYPDPVKEDQDVTCALEPNPKNYDFDYYWYVNGNLVKQERGKTSILSHDHYNAQDTLKCEVYYGSVKLGEKTTVVEFGDRKVILTPSNPNVDSTIKCYVDPNPNNYQFDYYFYVYDRDGNQKYSSGKIHAKEATLPYTNLQPLDLVECEVYAVDKIGEASVRVANRNPSITSITTQPTSVKAGESVKIICNANDPDEDTVNYLYAITKTNTQPSSNEWKVQNTFNVPNDWRNEAYAWCKAYDNYNGYDIKSTSFEVMSPNHAPSLNIPDQTIDEGRALELNLNDYASDPDGDTLSYTLVSGVGSISGNTYTFTANWDDDHKNETYDVKIKACDAEDCTSDTFTIRVNDINRKPEIDSVNVPTQGYVYQTITFSAQAHDDDNDALTYHWDFGDGSAADGNSVNHAYNATGNYTLTLTVSDGIDSVTARRQIEIKGTLNANITCFDKVINGSMQACTIHAWVNETNAPAQGNVELTDSSITKSCNLSDGSCSIVYNVSGIGTHNVIATIHSFATKTLNYSYEVLARRYDVELHVYNDSGYSNEEDTFYRGQNIYLQFRVKDLITNNYVTDLSLISDVTLVMNAGGRLDFTYDGINNEYFRYHLTIPLTDDYLSEGYVFTIVVNLTDNSGGEAVKSVYILNNKPTISCPQEVNVNGFARVICNVEDVEDMHANDFTYELFYSTTDANIVARLYDDNGVKLELNITALETKDSRLNISVMDSDNDIATASILMHLQKQNHAPSLNIPNQTIDEGQALELNLNDYASDADGDTLSYTLVSGVGSISGNTYTFTANWDDDHENETYDVKIKACDAEDCTSDTFTIHVNDINRKPEILETNVPQIGHVKEYLRFSALARDPENDPLNYTWIIENEQYYAREVLYKFTQPGVYNVSLIVKDNYGAFAERNFTIAIDVNQMQVDVELLHSKVIAGSDQVIHFKVYNLRDNMPIVNAKINLLNTSYSCDTDVNGECAIIIREYETGIKEYHYLANATGFDPVTGTIVYEVLPGRYEIRDLKLFSDSQYLHENYVYYRGQEVYARFRVYDLVNNQYLDNQTQVYAKLVDLSSGALENLTFYDVYNYYYKFSGRIPVSHSYLGASRVYGLVIDVNGYGAEAYVNLTILNNKPVMNCDKNFINITNYDQVETLHCVVTDKEDNNFRFEVSHTDDLNISYHSEGSVIDITIRALKENNGSFIVRAYDLDNAVAYVVINYSVNIVTPEEKLKQITYRAMMAKNIESKIESINNVGAGSMIDLVIRNNNDFKVKAVKIKVIARDYRMLPLKTLYLQPNEAKRVRLFIPKGYDNGIIVIKNDYYKEVLPLLR